MMIADRIAPGHYLAGWLLMIVSVNTAALTYLAASGRSVKAVWYWLLFTALLGPVAVSRLSAVSVAIAMVGITALSPDPSRFSTLLGSAW